MISLWSRFSQFWFKVLFDQILGVGTMLLTLGYNRTVCQNDVLTMVRDKTPSSTKQTMRPEDVKTDAFHLKWQRTYQDNPRIQITVIQIKEVHVFSQTTFPYISVTERTLVYELTQFSSVYALLRRWGSLWNVKMYDFMTLASLTQS